MKAAWERRVKFVTLGCRLNQYETQAIREQFQRAGYSETSVAEEADVLVINTCTVTGEADRQGRYWIRRFHRTNPRAKIVVAGCYVERDRKTIEAMPGVSLTLLNREKPELLNLLESCTDYSMPRAEAVSSRVFPNLSISQFEGRRRAILKIQDGCNHACSFCKVVLVRGPSRSRSMDDVLLEAERLVESGHPEIVLTGIQLGAYGFDLERRQMLPELIERLREVKGLMRIRLSSIEPTDVTDELIDSIASVDRVCPHLHIPLQSGDDGVLRGMNRRYGCQFYRNLIQKLYDRMPDFVLTTDVMVGFPGEMSRHFKNTVQLLDDIKPYKLHVFPYSAREGTKANRLANEVSTVEKMERRSLLLELEAEWRKWNEERFLGRKMEVLLEDESREDERWARASNFIKLRIPRESQISGELFDVHLVRSVEGLLSGTRDRALI